MAGWSSASAKPWNGAAVLKSNPWATAAMRCAPTGTAWSMPAFWVLVRGPQGECTWSGIAQHRSVGGPGADAGMVCAALATGGHLVSSTGRLFQEVRAHLGEEAQRQWPDRANARYYANPDGTLLLDHPSGLSSAATTTRVPIAQQPWYGKPLPAFVDASALVRRLHGWRLRLASEGLSLAGADPEIRKVPAGLYHRLADALAYAA